MVIMGVNGWFERSHDASACLVIDGKIVAAAEEERFVRSKHAYDHLPMNSIGYCLERAGIFPDDIDLIAWGWDIPGNYQQSGRGFNFSTEELNRLLFPSDYYRRSKTIPVEFVTHHLAHAASAYYCSGFSSATVVVIDGQGENQSSSVWRAENGVLSEVIEWPIEFSLGYFYEAGCKMLGFSRTHAGKLMGLASYASPMSGQSFFSLSSDELLLANDWKPPRQSGLDLEEEIIRYWLECFIGVWGEQNQRQYSFNRLAGKFLLSLSVNDVHWQTIAATIQYELERVYVWMIEQGVKQTGIEDVALAGGVALNCSANGSLMEKGFIKRLFVQPVAGDAGVSLGAALYCSGSIPSKSPFSPYLGPQYSTAQIYQYLRQAKLDFYETGDLPYTVAKAIASGAIVGWFQGSAEVGPRALGARSILADARALVMHDSVNEVKNRELWRPLAPSLPAQFAGDYFTSSDESPYMLRRTYVRSGKEELIPAVTHVDGSARPQTVTIGSNRLFYDLLMRFEGITSLPLLMNTSFNNEREPMVCTPMDAVVTFMERGVDLLAIGPFLVRKKGVNYG